jgi:adenosylmethionine-8-amino-7-oxononanoate aminotransferase
MKRIEAYHTFSDLSNRPAEELCDALAARAPMENAKVFLTSGGGDSIEVAAKLARRHFLLAGQPERVHLISRTQGYHGTHGVGTSIGGIAANRVDVGPLDPNA